MLLQTKGGFSPFLSENKGLRMSIIEKLMEPLDREDVELRVGATTEKGFALLLYKTARTDAKRLNESCGLMWQNHYHYDAKGLLCCDISIWDETSKQWVVRGDVGTESNTEKEKGSYSDAFKRAGFKWGIGAELYNSPFIWVSWPNMRKNEYGKGYIPTGFRAQAVEITDYYVIDGRVESITLLHDGKVIFKYGDGRKAWPVYADATPKVQKQALAEFKRVCDTLEVDPLEFLTNQGQEVGTEADKYKSVRTWLNGSIDQLHDQLLVYKGQ